MKLFWALEWLICPLNLAILPVRHLNTFGNNKLQNTQPAYLQWTLLLFNVYKSLGRVFYRNFVYQGQLFKN